MFIEGPSYRPESFELRKILRAVRRKFSALAKFTCIRFTNAQAKFGTARHKFVDAWVRYANEEFLNTGPPLLRQRCPGAD
jgi:hypothetical protein